MARPSFGGKTIKASNIGNPAPLDPSTPNSSSAPSSDALATTSTSSQPPAKKNTLSVLQTASMSVANDELKPATPAKSTSSSAGLGIAEALQAANFEVNDRVEAQFKGKGKFYPGKITNAHADGTCDVLFDDGDKDSNVKPECIRSPPKPAAAKVADTAAAGWVVEGDKVEAQFKGKGKFYPGTVTAANDDGTINVTFDDGDKDSNIKPEGFRVVSQITASEAAAQPSNVKVDDRVEAQYKGKGKHYPGKVVAINEDGTVEVLFDDGDKDTSVKPENFRIVAPKQVEQVAVAAEILNKSISPTKLKSPREQLDANAKTILQPASPRSIKKEKKEKKELEKTIVSTPAKAKAPTPARSPGVASPAASPRDVSPTPEEKAMAKAKKRLESNASSSAEEARSRQRRAQQQREGMSINLEEPDEDVSPLIAAAAKGDMHALEKAAAAFSRGTDGTDPTSTSGVAALRTQKDGVTALHYAAYFQRKHAAKKLLELAILPVKLGAQLEISALIGKRQRFLEEARYNYRQAIDQHQLQQRKQIVEDAEAYAAWCGDELTRILRSREMRCEERWKMCLTARDNHGRTPLMYAASSMGGDDVIKTMLTTGRACLSANAPEPMDVMYFLNSADNASSSLHKHKHGHGQKNSKKESKSLFSSTLRFVPPPCNTSKFDKMTIMEMTLTDEQLTSSNKAEQLFPRDESFHRKTGHIRMRQKKQKEKGKTVPGLRSKLRQGSGDEYTGGDPCEWLGGRLIARVSSKSGSGSGGALLKLFKKHDSLSYGSLELDSFQSLLNEEDIKCDEEVVTAVMEQFRDNRNDNLTCKYRDLVDWTIDNCKPPKTRKADHDDDEEEEEQKDSDSEEEGKEEEKDDEEKKEEEEHTLREAQREFMSDPNSSEFTTVGDIREARCDDIVDVVDNAGRTSLHISSAIGDAITVKMLVKFGASREKRASDGESALSYAGTRIVRTTLLNSLLSQLEGAKHIITENERLRMKDWILMLGEGGLNVNDPLGGLDLSTPLHIAAIAGLPEVIEMLLEKRANVDAGDENGWTPLMHAAVRAGKDRRKVAKMLIEEGGCKIGARSSCHRTALHLAAIGEVACTDFGEKEFLDEFGNPTKKDNEDTMMIELLLLNGANTEAVDSGGCTPLHRAAEQGRSQIMWALMKGGANIYAMTPKRWNSLHFAAFNGEREACRLLVQRDAEKGRLKATRDSQRCSPSEVAKDEKTRSSLNTIWEAAKECDLDTLVRCIAMAGNDSSGGVTRKPWIPAGLEDQTWESGFKVIHSAILGHGMRVKKNPSDAKRSADKTIQTVCLLCDKHCFVNGLDKMCRTAMHFAAMYGLIDLIDVLVRRGGEVAVVDVMGSSPLHYAYAFGQVKCVELLIRHGADEDERNRIVFRKDDDDSDDDEEDAFSSDEDNRRGKKGKKKKKNGKRKKGRLPRECAGLKEKVFPSGV
jgi:ankyrin repeat protein